MEYLNIKVFYPRKLDPEYLFPRSVDNDRSYMNRTHWYGSHLDVFNQRHGKNKLRFSANNWINRLWDVFRSFA